MCYIRPDRVHELYWDEDKGSYGFWPPTSRGGSGNGKQRRRGQQQHRQLMIGNNGGNNDPLLPLSRGYEEQQQVNSERRDTGGVATERPALVVHLPNGLDYTGDSFAQWNNHPGGIDITPPRFLASNNSSDNNGAAPSLFPYNSSNSSDDTNTSAPSKGPIYVRYCRCGQPNIGVDDMRVFYFCGIEANYCTRRLYGNTRSSTSATGESSSPTCVIQPLASGYARSIWPVVLSCFLMILFLLSCTTWGGHALGCVVSTLLLPGCWNERFVVPHMLRNDVERAYLMILRNVAYHHGNDREVLEEIRRMELQRAAAAAATEAAAGDSNDDGGNDATTAGAGTQSTRQKPTKLVLKTKRYYYNDETDAAAEGQQHLLEGGDEKKHDRAPDRDDNDDDDDDDDEDAEKDSVADADYLAPSTTHGGRGRDDDDDDGDSNACGGGIVSCTICYAAVENGDRVGALECGHLFHVDCLKGWLKRRNVCPLCLRDDVASPRHNNTNDDDDNNNETSGGEEQLSSATTASGQSTTTHEEDSTTTTTTTGGATAATAAASEEEQQA